MQWKTCEQDTEVKKQSIYSMTAFARAELNFGTSALICELRSVNHRYLEINVYLPEALRAIEMNVRENIRAKINRGKIDCYFRIQPHDNYAGANFKLNLGLVKALVQAHTEIARELKNLTPPATFDFLTYPGVMQAAVADNQQLIVNTEQLMEEVLNNLLVMRVREGEKIAELFKQKVAAIKVELAKIKQHLPELLREYRTRLSGRIAELNIDCDPARIEQEMVILAHKLDVVEEFDRAQLHLTELESILAQGGLVGRRLDFLLQELNRETNTLSAKSPNLLLTHAIVEIKVLLEQIREQVQNIE